MNYYPVPSPLIEFLILSLVDKQDSYGYEISQNIKLVTTIKESQLYPILKKLEKASYVESYSGVANGRKRKYYCITKEGKEHLDFLMTEWIEYTDKITKIAKGELRHDKE